MAQSTVTDSQSDLPQAPPPKQGSRRTWWVIGGIVLVAAVVAIVVALATSSSGPASASSQVKTNWQVFFKGSTPVATRVSLLQNGSALQQVIQRESMSGFARGLSASVSKVQFTSPTTANVSYTVLVGGTPLTPLQGQAVKVGRTWVVSTQSFCGLLALQHVTPPVCTASG